MADFHSGFRPYGSSGDRKLEIVNSRVGFSATHGYLAPPPPPDLASTTSRKSKGSSSSSAVKPWSFNDPEMKRKKRVARYKVYGVEGRVKASFRKGLRWIKNKCSEIVHGW
ncbi:hypothetical protein AAC387_Pa10g1907 [Persea americana]